MFLNYFSGTKRSKLTDELTSMRLRLSCGRCFVKQEFAMTIPIPPPTLLCLSTMMWGQILLSRRWRKLSALTTGGRSSWTVGGRAISLWTCGNWWRAVGMKIPAFGFRPYASRRIWPSSSLSKCRRQERKRKLHSQPLCRRLQLILNTMDSHKLNLKYSK